MAFDMKKMLEGKRILVTGGTGSLGKVLTTKILSGAYGRPERLIVMSRDEAKHHDMRVKYHHMANATEDIIYRDYNTILRFRVGDVRDYNTVAAALRDIDIVFNAAALKQVPSCEYFPGEAVETNVLGPRNIVRAIVQNDLPVQIVIGISTDKACLPVNAMGMTKALQERVFIAANLDARATRFTCARYGNVLASRGSVIPLFHTQIMNGGPVTLTHPEMTRYFLSLNDAVETVMVAVGYGSKGDIFIPKAPASRIEMLARALIGRRNIELKVSGIRPGEKIHETLIAEDEAHRTVDMEGYYIIRPALPELASLPEIPALQGAYSSNQKLMSEENLNALLTSEKLRIEDKPDFQSLY